MHHLSSFIFIKFVLVYDEYLIFKYKNIAYFSYDRSLKYKLPVPERI